MYQAVFPQGAVPSRIGVYMLLAARHKPCIAQGSEVNCFVVGVVHLLGIYVRLHPVFSSFVP